MTHDDPSQAHGHRGDEPTESEIRERAFLISQRPDAATPEENWIRARRELQEELTRGSFAANDTHRFPPFTSAKTHP